MNIKGMLKPVLVLFFICLLTTAALAGTNMLTKGKIQENAAMAEIEARQQVLPEADSFETRGEYAEGLSASGETVGYVFVTETKGYGGTIRVMTGINTSGSITGVSILEHSETVGLGANVEKADFSNQFQGEIPENGFTVVKTDPSAGEIAAVTGATISSNAVTNAVNQALALYQSVKGGD